MADATPQTGYAPVNSLDLYYECRQITWRGSTSAWRRVAGATRSSSS